MQSKQNTRLVQSASALGAAILGFAIGGLWGGVMGRPILIIFAVLGAIIHTYGMYMMQMKAVHKEGDVSGKILWITAWICLLSLVALFTYLIISK